MTTVLGQRVVGRAPLQGGCIADVARIELADGRVLVEKRRRQGAVGGAGGDVPLEGWMLRYLAEHTSLPVPDRLFRAA